MSDENIQLLLSKRRLDGLIALADDAVGSTGLATINFAASGAAGSTAVGLAAISIAANAVSQGPTLSTGTASITFAASGAGAAAGQIPTTDEYAALLEFALTSGGTEVQRIYKSFVGVRTPSADYEQGWISSGMITRAIGPGAEPYSIGHLTTQLHNTNREFSKLKDAQRFRGRKQTVKYGRIQDGLAEFRTLFVGAVDDWRIGNSVASFTLKDAGIDRFRQLLRNAIGTVNTSIFPDLPAGRPEVLIPLVYGDFSTNGGNMTGAGPLPCHLIDADAAGKWRYLACGDVMQSVDTVYVYGEVLGSGFTVTTATYGGRDMTVIDFDADPRDPDRPNETEVTIAGKGIVDEFAVLYVNPTQQLRHFLITYGGWNEGSEFHGSLWANALNDAGNAQYKTACYIGGDPDWQRIIDVINEFTRSVLLYIWMTPDNLLGAYILTLANAQNPPAAAFSVDETAILKKSFSCFGNRDVFSSISFQRVYNWTLGRFAVVTEGATSIAVLRSVPLPHTDRTFPVAYEDRTFPMDYDAGTTGDLDLGDADTPEAPARVVPLKYVADEDTAIAVATVYAMLGAETVQFCEFELPPEYLLNEAADLNRYVAVTHWQGISDAGGYVNALFRIVRTETSIEPKHTRIRCTGIRLIA